MDTGQQKNKTSKIILALDLIAMKFSGLLTIDFLETQFNGG